MKQASVKKAREALVALPEGTTHGETPSLKQVYLPQSHIKAINPNVPLVIGMRGAGKTFWWGALQDPAVRRLASRSIRQSGLTKASEVRTGFGVGIAPDEGPDKDILRQLMVNNEPRMIWRTVQARHVAPDDHPLRKRKTWAERVKYVGENPEEIAQLFYQRDIECEKKNVYFMILFDALDRCADEWTDMYRAIRGLLQTALEMRSYRRLRTKVFLRSEQLDETKIGDFPDASKILSSPVTLNWSRNELYGLLWHSLASGEYGSLLRRSLADDWRRLTVMGESLFFAPSNLVFDEEVQRGKFHELAGQWMGKDRRRGFPYTWIPNHLADANGRVSPRSFLEALRKAAEHTAERYSNHRRALHYESIKQGVQAASSIRVKELQEDYPWVHQALAPLNGMVVPCKFGDIAKRWRDDHFPERLREEVADGEVKLPPRRVDEGPEGIRKDLEDLGIFQRLNNGRVNVPDVFRVGYRLGRKGGVKPVR